MHQQAAMSSLETLNDTDTREPSLRKSLSQSCKKCVHLLEQVIGSEADLLTETEYFFEGPLFKYDSGGNHGWHN